MKLSIAMMVKNESKHLEDCLKSLQPIRDVINSELIIVDTGSTDNTVEIAKKYTDKVYFHQWNDNFSEIRNITVKYSIGEWFFYIDGDEVIDNPEGIIEFFIEDQYKKFNSACISILNFQNSQQTESSLFLAPRLFKKDKNFHFNGAIHNQPTIKQPMAKLKGRILHYGYISDDKELMERKFQRTATILKSELEKDPRHIYYRYQLAVSYSMHKDYKESLEECLKAYETLNKSNYDKRQYIYVYNQLIKGLMKAERYLEAEKIAIEAIDLDSENIDAFIWLGKIQFLNKNYKQARINYEKYLELLDEYKALNAKNLLIISYTLEKDEVAYIDLFQIYYEEKEFAKCIDVIEKIDKEEFYDSNFEKIVDCFITLEKYQELKKLYLDKNIGKDKSLYKTFVCAIDNRLKLLAEKERCEVWKWFTQEEASYDLLNKIRIDFYNEQYENIVKMTTILLNQMQLNKAVDFFGDAFYILISMKQPVSQYFCQIAERNINIYLDFAKDYHKDYLDKVLEYLHMEEENVNFGLVKVRKILARSLLELENMPKKQYLWCFKKYIDYGVRYIMMLYNKSFLNNDYIYDLKNDEEMFLLYMYKAEIINMNNELEYIKCLRKALEVVPMMKKGVELLISEMKEKPVIENPEMETLKIQLKENIRNFIENGNIDTAEALIKEYESIISNDVEIVLFKSQISIIKLKEEKSNSYKM